MNDQEYKELKIWMKRMENKVNSHFNYLQMLITSIGSKDDSRISYVEYVLDMLKHPIYKALNKLGIKDEEGDEW